MPTGSQEPSSSLRPFVRRARMRRWLRRRRRRIIVGAIILIILIIALILALAFIVTHPAPAPVGGQLVAMPDGSLP
jgi:uncharacterized membrane protein